MTTKPKTPAVYTQHRAQRRISSGAALGIVLGAVVVIAAVVAIAMSLGGGSSGKTEIADSVDISGTILPVLPKSGDDPAVTQKLKAPTLNGQSFDGSKVSIVPGGKPKLVAVVAHWCPHCQVEVPRLVQWEADGGKPADLEIYGVSSAVAEGADSYPPSAWLEREGFPGPVLVDEAGSKPGVGGPAAEAYGTSGFPFVVIMDANGIVKARHAGEFASVEEFDAWVDAALAA
ncbi:MAG TPA: TlpA disulfide reductase family protein [Acidimicrobiales bacterium]